MSPYYTVLLGCAAPIPAAVDDGVCLLIYSNYVYPTLSVYIGAHALSHRT